MQALWRPSPDVIEKANMTRFARFVSSKHSLNFDSYQQLYNWSIENIPQFWECFWDFADPVASRGFDLVVDDLNKFPGAKWFVGARLNFAENLLRQRASDKTAIVSRDEHSSGGERISYGELYQRVAILANYLRELGLKSGDRVAAYMPNIPSTIIAMLASTSIGATWAACGTELGSSAVLDRIGQITPKILFTVSDYQYKGKRFNLVSGIEKLVSEIPSLERVIVFPNLEEPSDFSTISKSISSKEISGSSNLKFEQLPAEHPLYIMFSSGTTGKPKSIVQSAGGILLNQLKELTLHSDLKEDDIIVYLSSPSWMMWNWVVCSLAVGSTLLLYDGDPNFPDWKTMWKIIEEEKISVFGCSASYINNLRNLDATPKHYDLSKLREISQTGSSLSKEGFEWLYSNVKSDFHFNSISGGTDINGCFAIGNPTIPVYAGEIQAPGLAMKIKSYDENANAVQDKEGELVCEAPSPSMPLCFWNDPNDERYLETYFAFFKGKKKKENVWRHGDYVLFHSDTGGITFYGRSDSVLKPSGVRIGTAEIYNIVEQLPEIADSLAIGQNWKGDQRIILFVKLKQGFELNDELKNKIKSTIREKASPRHVPALIFESPEIPYTFNMKKVESAVTNLANGRAITNIEALVNPSSLDYYKNILDRLQG